jgi:hypothetical protein
VVAMGSIRVETSTDEDDTELDTSWLDDDATTLLVETTESDGTTLEDEFAPAVGVDDRAPPDPPWLAVTVVKAVISLVSVT